MSSILQEWYEHINHTPNTNSINQRPTCSISHKIPILITDTASGGGQGLHYNMQSTAPQWNNTSIGRTDKTTLKLLLNVILLGNATNTSNFSNSLASSTYDDNKQDDKYKVTEGNLNSILRNYEQNINGKYTTFPRNYDRYTKTNDDYSLTNKFRSQNISKETSTI